MEDLIKFLNLRIKTLQDECSKKDLEIESLSNELVKLRTEINKHLI